MGGKPNPGTKRDKRLKRNRKKRLKSRLARGASAAKRAFASTRSADGQFPI